MLLQVQKWVSMPGVALWKTAAYMTPWCLEPRAERLSSEATDPQFPTELIPVAGGGGEEGSSRRRRKGREVSAEVRTGETEQRRTGEGEREKNLSTRAVPPEGAGMRRPRRMGEVGGEGPPAATLCVLLPEDLPRRGGS